jgi:hypothetical protein
MIAALLAPVRARFAPWLAAAAGIAATLVLSMAYDALIDDPAVARAAREGFVRIAEKAALEAQLAETRRQLNAGAQALEEHRKRLAAKARLADTAREQMEQEIARYETELDRAGRRCDLDAADIEWLHQP